MSFENKNVATYIVFSFLIVAAYYGSSVLVRPLILPPTFAAPIWPAAGIATGALILWGYKYIPAILIGEILVNLNFYKIDEFHDNPTLMVTYSLMLLATTIRSTLAAYLVRKYLGNKNQYLTFQSIVKLFILAGIVPTFISSSLSTLTLYDSNLLEDGSVWLNFLTWWFGDSVGVFILLPMMLLLFKKPREVWKKRLFKTVIPVLLTFFLLLIIAQNLKNLEHKRLISILDNRATELSDKVFKKFSMKGNKLHNIHPNNFSAKMSQLLKQEVLNARNDENLKDAHFVISFKNGNTETIIAESENRFKKSKKWRSQSKFDFGQYKWIIEAYTTSLFFVNSASWLIWWLLSTGFLFIALMEAGLLVITGNEIKTINLVKKRTKEIETLNK
ncbi:MAG TPA: hypothetical protein ENJ44_07095, partial [Oceanospirillales bacterium]|nr:hypothetical protein [Oceanospirillales bacterium]